jgi:hypothetical protein
VQSQTIRQTKRPPPPPLTTSRPAFVTARKIQPQSFNNFNNNFYNYVNYDDSYGVQSIQEHQVSGLITGGRTASRGQFPWLVAFFYNDKFICGGSLISKKLVVTAAHCILEKRANNIPKSAQDSTFYIGKTNINSLLGETNYVSLSRQIYSTSRLEYCNVSI